MRAHAQHHDELRSEGRRPARRWRAAAGVTCAATAALLTACGGSGGSKTTAHSAAPVATAPVTTAAAAPAAKVRAQHRTKPARSRPHASHAASHVAPHVAKPRHTTVTGGSKFSNPTVPVAPAKGEDRSLLAVDRVCTDYHRQIAALSSSSQTSATAIIDRVSQLTLDAVARLRTLPGPRGDKRTFSRYLTLTEQSIRHLQSGQPPAPDNSPTIPGGGPKQAPEEPSYQRAYDQAASEADAARALAHRIGLTACGAGPNGWL